MHRISLGEPSPVPLPLGDGTRRQGGGRWSVASADDRRSSGPHPCHNEGGKGLSRAYQGSRDMGVEQGFSGFAQVVGS